MTQETTQPGIQEGDLVNGFRATMVRPVPALRGTACMFQHLKTGAEFLDIVCNDAENLFSISLPTPPQDDTGLPHILEHAVLAGSKRFPVREPFFEMIKMSMATFINAMTGWDCTYYPVCSNVRADLFNLAEVYFDAVFHPLLAESTFRREGHHLAPADDRTPPEKLTINGIVYNEMKSYFSQPEGCLYRLALRGLFPDTPYGRESGGDPDAIPSLTYEDFCRFHRDHYNPTNARILCYGDIHPHDHLAFLAPRLEELEPGPRAPAVPKQPRWDKPRTLEETYAIGEDEDETSKTYLVTTWIVGNIDDPVDLMALYILGLVLTGNEAAPLRKALVGSKLGEDVVFAGFATVGLEAVFRVGLKGSEPDRAEAFVEVVRRTLSELAEKGVEDRHVRAAFQQAAYDYLEINSHYPLHVLDEVMDAWVYDKDPLTYVDANTLMETCKEQYRADSALFRTLIRERLLDNAHRLDLTFKPDRHRQREADRTLEASLAERRQNMSDDEAERLAREAESVEREGAAPNAPEDIATLPQLSVADLPDCPRQIPSDPSALVGGGTFIHNHVFANGVNYLRIEFDLGHLPADLWDILPRYVETVRKLGAGPWDYQETAWRKAEATGGISLSVDLRTALSPAGQPVRGMTWTLKALDGQLEQALDVLGTLLFGANPDDFDRFLDVVIQARARLRTKLVQDGLGTAGRHGTSRLFAEAALGERLRGMPELRRVEDLVDSFDSQFENLKEDVLRIRQALPAPNAATVSFTGSDRAAETVRSRLEEWLAGWPEQAPATDPAHEFVGLGEHVTTGLAGPIQVAHCTRSFLVPGLESPDAPLLMVGTQLINIDYLISEIRLKGNAYGAGCRYRGLPGHMTLFSYADPHIARTYRVFDGLLDYVYRAPWTRTELERAIITSAKAFHTPVRPEAATAEALDHWRTGVTAERRNELYQRLLAADVEDVRGAFTRALERGRSAASDCVVSSRSALEKAKAELSTPLTITSIL